MVGGMSRRTRCASPMAWLTLCQRRRSRRVSFYSVLPFRDVESGKLKNGDLVAIEVEGRSCLCLACEFYWTVIVPIMSPLT